MNKFQRQFTAKSSLPTTQQDEKHQQLPTIDYSLEKLVLLHEYRVWKMLQQFRFKDNNDDFYKKKMSMMNIFLNRVKLFCLYTYLHGYQFIVLPKRVLLERVLWVVLCMSSWIMTIVFICISNKRLSANFTITVTDSINYPIWNFAFPAVTICSFNKISRQRALEQAELIPEKLNHTTEEIAQLFPLMGHLYFNNVDVTRGNGKVLELIRLLDHNDINLNKLLRNLAPSCKNMVQKCRWRGEEITCDMIFEKILTSEGYCCSFNYFAPKNHTFGGLLFPGKSPKKPRHLSACGYESSLEVVVDTNKTDYFASEMFGYGNKVLLHSPYNYPDWGERTYFVGVKSMSFIELSPTFTYSGDDMKTLRINERKCYFSDEMDLKNFQIYSYENCLIECRINISLLYCGCIPVTYVNEDDPSVPNRRICSIRDIPCLSKNKKLFKSSIPGRNNETNPESIWTPGFHPCDCLPDCTFTEYDIQGSQSVLTTKYTTSPNEKKLFIGLNLENQSVVRVFFKDLVGTKNRRSAINSWHTYLAFYGGIVGLFLGFSFISGIEFVFFFTVKLFSDAWKVKKIGMEKKMKKNIGFHHVYLNEEKKKKNQGITPIDYPNNLRLQYVN